MSYSQRIPFAALGFAMFTLLMMVAVNWNTPFRAEHWALLHAIERSPDFATELRHISHFVCFGVQRFQPVAFFPTSLTYWIFGVHYGAHYLISVLLQGALALLFGVLLETIAGAEHLTLREVIKRRALEIALFAVAFPASDVVLWTFFHYIQLACLLALAALITSLRTQASEIRITTYAYAIAATLIYEAFVVLVAYQLACDIGKLWRRRASSQAAWLVIPLGFLVYLGSIYRNQYGAYFEQVARFNELQRSMVSVSLPAKVVHVIGKTVLSHLTTLYAMLVPQVSERHHIYELLAIPPVKASRFDFHTFTYVSESLVFTLTVLFFLIIGGAFWKCRRSLPAASKLIALLVFSTAPFLVIAWGRPVFRDVAVSHQFRYALVGLPALLALALILFRQFTARYYVFMLSVLTLVNAWSSLNQAWRVREDMAPLRTRLRGTEDNRSLTVETAMKGILEEKLKISDPKLYPFAYNAQKCLSEWYEKVPKKTAHSMPQ